jgi:hypothetical protein
VKRAAAAAAALALAFAGCDGGEGETTEPATTAPPPATTTGTTTATTEPPSDGRAAERAFRAFLAAAARGDADALWEGLSAGSRRRLGPTKRQFAESTSAPLEQGLGGFSPDAVETVVAETTSAEWAVVAVKAEGRLFATALHREQGRWRVDVGGVVAVDPVHPLPGGTPTRPQLSARVDAAQQPEDARLWLDGRPLPATVGRAGLVSAPLGPLDPGTHTVVAFARTADDAAATGWTIRFAG